MKRFLSIILIITSFNINVIGGNKNVKGKNEALIATNKWDFGVEWSYVGTYAYNTKYNFFNTEGYRVNAHSEVSGYWSNAEVLLHAGYNLNRRWNISLYTGVIGLADIHYAVPVSLRMTHYFAKNSILADTWLAFAEVGSGICIKNEPQEIWSGKIGGGYRINLSEATKLDFIAAFRLTYTHPQIIDGNDKIPLEYTNLNSALLQSFSIGMAITF